MSEIRRDPLRSRWVLIDPDQPVRLDALRLPKDAPSESGDCPLCPGNEAILGPQLYNACSFAREASGRDCMVKVVPNGRPLLRTERELVRSGRGPFDFVTGAGAHEVIIETQEHGLKMAELGVETIAHVFTAARVRMADLRNDVRLRYHLLFKQQGAQVGARFDHSHSQILATPEIPPFIATELENSLGHFRQKERCLLCDLLAFETVAAKRIVAETSKFVALAPYASARPFELWLMPKRHCHDIVDSVCEDVRELAHLLKDILGRLDRALDGPPLTMTLVNAPTPHHPPGRQGEWEAIPHAFHWRLALVPRVTVVTGLEWDTGLSVNPVAPEKAAAHLRSLGSAQ